MSGKLLGLVYDTTIPTEPPLVGVSRVAVKAVLARLADLAGIDGGSLFPSWDRIAADCELTRKQVQRVFAWLQEADALTVVRKYRRRPPDYRLNIDTISGWTRGDVGVPRNTSRGDARGPRGDVGVLQGGTPTSPRTVIQQSEERNEISSFEGMGAGVLSKLYRERIAQSAS